MTKKKVVIYDDEAGTRREWVGKLSAVRGFAEEFEALEVDSGQFRHDLEVLQERRAEARRGREVSNPETIFDESNILIVDYDLFEDNETGEEVAYLARCFSRCGIIAAVNQYAQRGFIFDLTLLGHPESFADLNLLADQVFDPGLWSTPWERFRPWYWPLLPRAVEEFEQRVLELKGNLGQKILGFLEIPPEIVKILPVDAVEFVSSEDATFHSFVNESGRALRGRGEKVASDEAVARIAAARLSKWLERLVLPGQNILVDAAHLLERYPSLFKGSPERLIDWPNAHELLAPAQAVMDIARIEQFRFRKSAWLSRTAWYWPLVSECEEISEVANPWDPRQKLAFCEDTSRFVYPSEDLPEFVAKVDSPFVRRFVSTRDPKYGPQLQFAL